ncbi:soluble N-ethylmaleimide-sensitive factor (NSF) attachment protein [Bodo saltans virus]|uniref:Soluble N-ethylmaleimide-sensitive factor (NSF) attachment protein n=1 Tax=Bodo saltans virus TaxID=2024608 RepID=A0A2H4UTS2_9VIRU|nr:soluble N-ethylmaleimide-sensitive factor (NSF) attachment protein [Bodo saltans virus]ATZ80332.1 soluble N-ethylmaleimide-sensitive factor (NSF) attachment protein [Bodo saltans virus]
MSGDELYKKAKKHEDKWFYKDDDAIYDGYMRAGHAYRYEKKYKQSADAYMSAGDNAIRSKNKYDACIAYTNCAEMYLKNNDQEKADIMTNIICKMHIENNDLFSAGKILLESANRLNDKQQYQEAITKYNQALQYFEAEDKAQSSNACMIKLAEIYTEINNFEEAIKFYDKLIDAHLDGLAKFKLKEYQFCSFLCRITLINNDNKLEQLDEYLEILDSYLAQNPNFQHSTEHEICRILLSAMADEDVELIDKSYELFTERRVSLSNTIIFNSVIKIIEDKISDIK